jgi:hypothetical protein
MRCCYWFSLNLGACLIPFSGCAHKNVELRYFVRRMCFDSPYCTAAVSPHFDLDIKYSLLLCFLELGTTQSMLVASCVVRVLATLLE